MNDVVHGWMPLAVAMIVPKNGLEGNLDNPLKIIGIISGRQVLGFPVAGNPCQFFLQIVKGGESVNFRRAAILIMIECSPRRTRNTRSKTFFVSFQ